MARLKDRLLGHQDLLEDLLPSLRRPETALTLLFAGPSGVGKKLTARAMAQALLCERDSGGCGECPSCLRVENGAHESVLELEPDGTQIKIDQARGVLEFLQLQSWGRARIVIIDEAQSLNPGAANSLLKILEEPPPGTFIVMLAPSPYSVLPTLRSRSRVILFKPLSEDNLRKLNPGAPAWILKAAHGSAERMKNLSEAAEQEQRHLSAQSLQAFLGDPEFLTSREGWREVVKEKHALPRVLAFWATALRDGLVQHAKGAPSSLMNPDQKELLALLAKEPRSSIDFLLDQIFRLEGELAFHRDAQLSVEEMWVLWQQARSKMAPIARMS